MKKKKYLIYSSIALVLILIIGSYQLHRMSEEEKTAQSTKTKVAASSNEESVNTSNQEKNVEDSITKENPEKKSTNHSKDKPQEKQVKRETKEQHEIVKVLTKVQKSKGTVLSSDGRTTKLSDYYSLANFKEGTLKKGETVKIVGEQSNWYVIKYKDEMFYIPKESVNPQGLRSVKATQENLCVFSEPDKGSKLLGDVEKGKTLGVVGIHNTFYKVIYGEGYGYIERSKFKPVQN